MVYQLAIIALLGLASISANLSTERASPRIPGMIGWPLTAVFTAAGIVLLASAFPVAVAISMGLLYLMAGISLVSAILGYRNRSKRRVKASRLTS